jgi:hypothetical protein
VTIRALVVRVPAFSNMAETSAQAMVSQEQMMK